MANMISTIVLCNVPITPTNQIDFLNRNEQATYFNSKSVKICSNCKYVPRTGKIKVRGYVDTFHNCNYGYYTNEYNGVEKTFYFWIVQKDALARTTTELTIQLDVYQTWFMDLSFKPCMVERKHVTNDTIGANTYPEDFELGDYVTRNRQSVSEMTGDMAFFVAVTDSENGNVGGGIFGRKYSGCSLVYFSYDSTDALTSYITELCNEGKGDAIAFIFAFPQRMLEQSSVLSLQDGDVISGIEGTMLANIRFAPSLSDFHFRGSTFTPKNNKLFIYPYNFITVTNPDGSNVVWKLENFTDSTDIAMRLETVMGQNPIFALTPNDYCGRTASYEDSITTQGYGLCSWNNDIFANWYAQNQHSIRAQSANAVDSFNANYLVNSNNYATAKANNDINRNRNTANTLLDSASALASGMSLDPLKVAGGVVNAGLTAGRGYVNTSADYKTTSNSYSNDLTNANLMNSVNYENTMRSLMGSVKDAQVQPNTAKGDTSACGLDVARNTMTFYINQTQIKPEYAKRIDMFFQMYGYQVNTVEVPVFRTRYYWNYIKTTNCTAVGNVPLEDKQALENIINNGLTIWHGEQYMYNYEMTNTIGTLIEGVV